MAASHGSWGIMERRVAGATAEQAWQAMAESLAALGEGRLIR